MIARGCRRAIVTAVLLGLVPALLVLPAAIADPVVEDKAAALDPDFATGRAAIEAKDWQGAIRALSSAALRDTRNADIQNSLGYAYRHTGQMTWRSSTTSARSSSIRGTAARTSTSARPT